MREVHYIFLHDLNPSNIEGLKSYFEASGFVSFTINPERRELILICSLIQHLNFANALGVKGLHVVIKKVLDVEQPRFKTNLFI